MLRVVMMMHRRGRGTVITLIIAGRLTVMVWRGSHRWSRRREMTTTTSSTPHDSRRMSSHAHVVEANARARRRGSRAWSTWRSISGAIAAHALISFT